MEGMKKVYICSPYAGDKLNASLARVYSRYAINQKVCPVTPHLLYPQFLNDRDPKQRAIGLKCGVELLKLCDELWVFGRRISEGMSREIDLAKEMDIPIRRFRLSYKEVTE